jgi:hypothetical protein
MQAHELLQDRQDDTQHLRHFASSSIYPPALCVSIFNPCALATSEGHFEESFRPLYAVRFFNVFLERFS